MNTKRILKITSVILIIFILFFISLAYFGYLDFKKTLITKISAESTLLIGQRVDIGDLSFSPSVGINIYDISIKNPKGFDSGQLLHMKRVYLKMKFSDFFKGRFYFKNIIVYSPELTVIKNEKGRLNVSDKLMHFFKKTPTIKYQIDEFNIDSGNFDFNKDKRYRNDNINLHLKNLSTDPGTKTLINGHISYAGESKIKIAGWAYLKDTPKKFNVSISSDGFTLSVFREFFNRYKIKPERAKIALRFDTEGDSENGFNLKSKIQIKSTGFFFPKKNMKDILLNTDAFFKIRENSVVINDFSMYSGGVLVLRSKAFITDIIKNPSYRAEIKINRIDLSAFNFIKNLKTSGIITSNTISVKGKFKKTAPEISGNVQIRDAAVKSNNSDIEKINATMEFLPDKGMSVKTDVTAKILKAGEYVPNKPVDIMLSIDTLGKLENMAFVSSATLSPLEMKVKGDKTVYLKSFNFKADGTIKDMAFSGKGFFEIKGIRYGDYSILGLNSSYSINHRKNLITINDLKIETEDLKSYVSQINIKMIEKRSGYTLEIKDMNTSYPEKEAEFKNFNLYMTLNKHKKPISGDFTFSTRKIMFKGINSGLISGSGRFDEKYFFMDIPMVEISGGRIKLTVTGKTSEGPFPVTIYTMAENIDMSVIWGELSKILEIPYSISGDIKSASFDGTLNSLNSLHGNSLVEAGKISVLKTDSKRDKNIIKDGYLNSKVKFAGNNLEFKADAGDRNISTSISGTVERFLEKDRSIKIKAKLPEVKVTDIRDSFWDTFPDSLLYAGLYGYISSDVSIDYSKSGLMVIGDIKLKDLILEGENREYSAGPINGIIPIAYSKNDDKQKPIKIPPLESVEHNDRKITIGSLSYGFRLLDNINIRVNQKGNVLNIRHLSGNIFGGTLNGSAVVNLSDGFNYSAHTSLKGISLTKLCNTIEPIRGYISGKVDGTLNIKGSGSGVSQLIGKADFWTYSTNDEETKISREFLQKVGGPSLKTYLGDRSFNKGIMSLYIQNGFIIFKELEISNRNFLGIGDLAIKVAPLNNRITIDHLMWTITEAARRAKKE